MIVKDESKVIKRCLESVKPIIDYWVIVDTGSTDGTQQIIKDFMKDIPGELHERPWVNFGHNRDEALKLAKNKGDYLLFIDADEYLAFEKDFKMPLLDKDLYAIIVRNKGFDTKRYCLINNKDAMLLEKALKDEPNNSRYIFYLARDYECAKMYPEALKNYERRSVMGGDKEEIFCSLYGAGRLQEFLKMPKDVIIQSYSKAFVFNPSRAESLYQLGKYYNNIGNYCLAYLVLKNALTIPLSRESIFVDKWIYDYGILFELSNTLYFLKDYNQAYSGYMQVLASPNLMDEFRKKVNNNLLVIRSKIYLPKFEGMFEEYSNKRLELIAKFLPETPVVFEAGGCYEDTVNFLNTWPKAKIISFEPNPESFKKLTKSTLGLSNVFCYNIALNNVNRKAILNVCCDENRTSSLLEPSEMIKDAYKWLKVEVPCVVLEDWCKEKKVDHLDFMCLNLEGMELLALESSSKILKTVKVIYTKTNFQEFRKGMAQYADLKTFLEKSGFKLLSHWYKENFQGEAIFVKKEIFDDHNTKSSPK
ncbi:MAG: FkbM family methyltransferase [Chlamydiae bacterium]|nr:FkbM family methyltransferase [Chlamydiota bacterium]